MTVPPPCMLTEPMLSRICGEYLEMPGLRLTQKQAQRLWGLDEATCAQVLEFLVEIKFLRRGDFGSYARCGDGAAPVPDLRMASAELRSGPVTLRRGISA